MDIKYITLGLFISATIFNISCLKDKNASKPCRGGRYSFEATSEFSPQKEIYNIGDTIFFNSSFSTTLFDIGTRTNIDFSNSLGVGGGISFAYLDTLTNKIVDSYSKFTVIPLIGTITPFTTVAESGINTRYVENSIYQFKIAIKLNEKGIFLFGVNNLGSRGLPGINCTNSGFSMKVTNTEKHINLFQYALNYTPDSATINNIYCFRVQ